MVGRSLVKSSTEVINNKHIQPLSQSIWGIHFFMARRSEVQSSGGNDRRRQSHCAPVDTDTPSVFHFYKIILSTTLEQKKLRIPYKFVRRFRDELTDVADFVIPNGRVWKVGLSKEVGSSNVWFDDGWESFAEHHSIGDGHFLLFGYRGLCSFNVFIFDATASEIEYPCHNEGPSYDHIGVTRNEVEMPDDSPSEILNSVNLSPSSSSLKSKLSDASANKRDSGETLSKLEQKLEMKRSRDAASMASRDFDDHLTTRNNRLKVDEVVEIIDIDDNETRREKLGKHGTSELDKPLDIEKESNRIKCGSGETESSAECEDKEIEIITSKKFKCVKATPETERAMAAAMKYMPKNPSFMVTLRAYSFQNNRLYVPSCFSRYLNEVRSECMKLQVADGREWVVHLIQRRMNHWDIGGGWNVFSADNHLEDGDVCVFELLKNKEVLKVSIFRASEHDGTHEN